MTTSTMTMTVATNLTLAATHCCPQCGFDVGLPPLDETQAALLDAQKQIADLQAQVRLLNQKASSAVDRWADYEDELAQLRSEVEASRSPQRQQQQGPFHSPTNSTAPTVSTPGPTPLQTPTASSVASPASPARSSFLSSTGAASRLSALLSPRKSTPNLKPTPFPSPNSSGSTTAPPQPTHLRQSSTPSPFARPESSTASLPPADPGAGSPSTDDLLEALAREQALRREAEGRLNETSREVEELSVSLFEQANEMVATERRARARLEERIETLEKRDADKIRRLERLEGAMERIDRVRSLLGQTEAAAAAVDSTTRPRSEVQEQSGTTAASTSV